MREPHVLFVAWWFPPRTGGGVYRPLNFLRFLEPRGYRLTVLTGSVGQDERVDPSLLARVPASVRVLRCPFLDPFRVYAGLRRSRNGTASGTPPRPHRESSGFKDWLSESFALPDRWRSWVLPATLRAAVGLAGDEPDLLFSTSPPHSVHLVGLRLKAMFQCPWVVDFRDPWVGNPFREFRAAALRPRDEALERQVMEEADAVVVNTPLLETRLRARYPGRRRLFTLPNGFDPEQAAAPAPPPAAAILEILHVGHLYGARSGRYLLEGLRAFQEKDPDAAAAVRVRLVGAIDGRDAFLARVRELGIEKLLVCQESVEHAESLRLQRAAGGLLILGVEGEGPEVQVPGKLYEYFAARRPVLTLSRKGGAIQQVLERARFPYELAEPDDPEDIAGALQRFVSRARRGTLEEFDDAALRQFRYDRLTQTLAECFESLISPRARRR